MGSIVEDFKWRQSRGAMRQTRSKWFAEKGYAAQLESFVDCIHKGTSPAVTVRDGARATVVCLRILEAARDKMPRPIDLDAVLR